MLLSLQLGLLPAEKAEFVKEKLRSLCEILATKKNLEEKQKLIVKESQVLRTFLPPDKMYHLLLKLFFIIKTDGITYENILNTDFPPLC